VGARPGRRQSKQCSQHDGTIPHTFLLKYSHVPPTMLLLSHVVDECDDHDAEYKPSLCAILNHDLDERVMNGLHVLNDSSIGLRSGE
jgi:hypothetical protein